MFDCIMVARGDLAVEVGDAVVPALQKRMIRLARRRTGLPSPKTQDDGIHDQETPSRPCGGVRRANAVLDGTDAVMLSAETATGQYPVETVAADGASVVEA